MKYSGSCHCGKVAYEVEGDLEWVGECNCSHCSRKGYLLWFVPRSSVTFSSGEQDLATYHFNKHVIDHHFCPDCGCGTFGFGVDPASGEKTAAVNVRCLEGVDTAALERKFFDGRSY